MKKLEERLPSAMFMRIHRSYIVNLSRIREVARGRILIDGEVSLPVGDLYRDAFQAWIDSKFMGK
jgi:DNA-binding LytR/AlgR family response regulator